MPEARIRSASATPRHPRPIIRILAAVFLLVGPLHPAMAQEDAGATEDNPFFYRIEDVRRYFAWGWNLIPTGIDLAMGYRLTPWFDGVDTILQATIGGGTRASAPFETPTILPIR